MCEKTIYFLEPLDLDRVYFGQNMTTAHLEPYVAVDQPCEFGSYSDKIYVANQAGANVLFGSTEAEFLTSMKRYVLFTYYSLNHLPRQDPTRPTRPKPLCMTVWRRLKCTGLTCHASTHGTMGRPCVFRNFTTGACPKKHGNWLRKLACSTACSSSAEKRRNLAPHLLNRDLKLLSLKHCPLTNCLRPIFQRFSSTAVGGGHTRMCRDGRGTWTRTIKVVTLKTTTPCVFQLHGLQIKNYTSRNVGATSVTPSLSHRMVPIR